MSGKTKPTIKDALVEAATKLQPKIITCAVDKDLGRFEAEILLAHILKKNRVWLQTHHATRITQHASRRFGQLVKRRQRHEPIAHIVGEKEFYGLPLRVDSRALIPRPESELLVDLAIEALRPEPSSSDLVWDVGTGSGAIALAIATQIIPRKVLATDVSPKALALARQNAKRLKLKNVTFQKANLLDSSVRRVLNSNSLPTTHDKLVIVANLPYLPTSDKKALAPDVVRYEPANALFAGTHGNDLIEKLMRQLASFDIHFSSAFFEFDPPQAATLKKLAKEFFPRATIRVHKDLAKRNRVLEINRR